MGARGARAGHARRRSIAAWPLVTCSRSRSQRATTSSSVSARRRARLDYPAFEIQVLDDSATTRPRRRSWSPPTFVRSGCAIEVIRHGDRDGAKAGALAFGLARARGEYVAIFDADFIPGARVLAPDALPHPRAPIARVGMVQGRWAHLRSATPRSSRAPRRSSSTGSCSSSKPAKAARRSTAALSGGTAGVWRCACIADAGGWSGRSITEDLELSQRASRRGWKMRHLTEVAVPAELPHTMRAFRAQSTAAEDDAATCPVLPCVVERAILTAPLHAWRQRLAMLARTERAPAGYAVPRDPHDRHARSATFTPGPWSSRWPRPRHRCVRCSRWSSPRCARTTCRRRGGPRLCRWRSVIS